MRDQPPRRCAVYTRKSTEEGLDQAFNSLDAQYEACAAYIASQQHEGWIQTAGRYDDGGFSGGTLDRPGLTQLLSDVKAGLVDVIIVYKIDRLTRSLTDFAKIVDVLDAAGASFVSITQSFNTTTSMGRLTLNVLLSFAQFEREVIAERVRDKVAASKARGIWMGGTLPIGYDVHQRTLTVNDGEAEQVRYIFRRYLELGTVPALRADLEQQRMKTKLRTKPDGTTKGGFLWRPGSLYHLLKNRIYIGKIIHKDKCYDGLHDAIVNDDIFEQVQVQLAANAVRHRRRENARHNSLLTGMIRDGLGRPLTPRHANKGPKRYCYYVSNGEPPENGAQVPTTWRIPAIQIEAAVTAQMVDMTGNSESWIDHAKLSAAQSHAFRQTANDLAGMFRNGNRRTQRDLLGSLDLTITALEDRLEASICSTAMADKLNIQAGMTSARIPVVLSSTIKRRGQELRMIFPPQNVGRAAIDEKLVALVLDANRARNILTSEIPPWDIAKLRRQARFVWLAPDIITSIMEGRQPVDLTARRLLRTGTLPLSWKQQRATLGFHK